MDEVIQNPTLQSVLLWILLSGGVIAAIATFLRHEISGWLKRGREEKAQRRRDHADIEVAKTQLEGDILGNVFDRMDRLEDTNERQRRDHAKQMRELRKNHRQEIEAIRSSHTEQMEAHIEEKQELREQLVLARQSKKQLRETNEQLEETNERLREQNEHLNERNEKLEVILAEDAES